MVRNPSSIALNQAIQFISNGWQPVPDDCFEGIYPLLTPSPQALASFIAAVKKGDVTLFGTFCFLVLKYDVIGQKYYRQGNKVAVARPPEVTIHALKEAMEIPRQEIIPSSISFEHCTLTFNAKPVDAPSETVQVQAGEVGCYGFRSVRVDHSQLLPIRRQVAEQARAAQPVESRLKTGPKEKFDRFRFAAIAAAIIDAEGIPATQIELVRRIQECMGDDAPGDSLSKELVSKFMRELTRARERVQ